VRIWDARLTVAKVSDLKFREKTGNSFVISNGLVRILPSQPPILAFGQAPKEARNGPEIPALRIFDLVSGLSVRRS
jgi:hypothetical protein